MNWLMLPFSSKPRYRESRVAWVASLLLLLSYMFASAVSPRQVGDINNDGELSVVDLTLLRMHVKSIKAIAPSDLPFADVNSDGVVNEDDAQALIRLLTQEDKSRGLPLTGIRETSPQNGEESVSSSRRTGIVVRFSMPVEFSEKFNQRSVFGASINGNLLNSRAELSSDGKKLTLFVTDKIPGNARVDVSLDTTGLRDILGRELDGDGDGNPGGLFKFYYLTESLVVVKGTKIKGSVYASEKSNGADVPLKGVIVRVAGTENAQTLTGEDGAFVLDCPAGRFFAEVDGRKVAGTNFPDGSYYPYVVKAWEAVAGSEDNLAVGTGKIYLPLIPAGALKAVDPTKETKIEVAASVIADKPEMKDVSISVPAGALRKEDGTVGGKVGMAPVPPDRLPEPLAPGLDFPLVITIQTDGAGTFDQPVSVKFPNLPDQNGNKLKAGEKTGLWSFNHDSGTWELQGPMTVTDDGNFVTTDPGVGVRQPGWHGVLPGSQGIGPKRAVSAPDLPKTVLKDVDDALKIAAQSSLRVRDAFMKLGEMRSTAEDLEQLVRMLQELKSLVGSYDESGAVPYWWSTYWIKLRIAKLKPSYDQLLPGGSRDLAKDLKGLKPHLTALKAYLGKLDAFNQKAYAASNSYTWLSTQFADSNASLLGMLNAEQAYVDTLSAAAAGFSATAFDDVAKVLFPSFGQPDPTRDQEMTALSSFLAAMSGVSDNVAIDHSQQLRNLKMQMSDYLARAGALSVARTNPSKYGYLKVDAIGEPQRVRSNAAGDYRMVLPPDKEFAVTFVDPKTLQIGVYVGISGWNGTVTDLYGPVLAPLQPKSTDLVELAYAKDTDGDKLADELERVIGTNVGDEKNAPKSPKTFADSDGDGLSDYLEVIRGKNPLSGLAVGTGVIFSATTSQTGYEATDIDAGNELLLLSEKNSDGAQKGGLMIYSLESKTEPLRQAWLPTDYPVYRVRYADTNFAVLSLHENGVAVVDISSPTNPSLKYSYKDSGDSVNSAILVGDILVLGVNKGDGTARIVLKDLETGDVIREETAGGTVSDIVANGTVVYALSKGNKSTQEWWWYWSSSSAVFVGDLNRARDTFAQDEKMFHSVTVREWEFSKAGGRLALAPGKLFYVYESGLTGLDIQNPLNPKLDGDVFKPNAGFQRGWRQVVFDGSLDAQNKVTFLAALGASGPGNADEDGDVAVFQYAKAKEFGSSMSNWWMYWMSSDTPMAQFQTMFETRPEHQRQSNLASGKVYSLVLAGGIAYAADKEQGLKVINYKKYDSQGVAPAIAIQSNSPSPKALAVPRVLSGGLLALTASPSDDVAVASVEWYVDGARVAVSGGSPWGYTMRLPKLETAASRRIKIEARVYDTGGNMTTSNESYVDVVNDPFPPKVVSVDPEGTKKEVAKVTVVFNEPMEKASLAGSLKIYTPGVDGKIGTADDVVLDLSSSKLEPNAEGTQLMLTFSATLAEGQYRAVLAGSVKDVAGNPLGEDYSWKFGVSLANRWLGGLGLWSDATKWSSGVVPSAGDHVIFPSYDAPNSPNTVVAGRTTFQPDDGTLIAGTNQLTRVLTKGIGDWGYSKGSQVPVGTAAVGMLVTGSMVAEGTYVKSVQVTVDVSDLVNQKQTTVLELSKPLVAGISGALPWKLNSGASLSNITVEGETNLVDVDLEVSGALTLSANLGFGGASTLGVGTINSDLVGAQIRSAAVVSTGSLVAGKTDSGAASLKLTRPLTLSGNLALESAGFRSTEGKLTSSRLQLASSLDLAGNALRIYGGYAGNVTLQPTVSGGTFNLIGSGTLAFDWKESLFEEASADWDKLAMKVSTATLAIPDNVTVDVAGLGKVTVYATKLSNSNSGIIHVDDQGWLAVYNYERLGDKSAERLGKDAKFDKLTGGTESQATGIFAPTYGGFMAIKQDGTLWATGYNYDGSLGPGSLNAYVSDPSPIGDGKWKFVGNSGHGGESYLSAFGLKDDGSLWAWGFNYYGNLGVGSSSDIVSVPTQVGTNTDWKAVSTGYYSTSALKDDGSLWSWGYNDNGVLGVGSASSRVSVPTQVGTDKDWEAVFIYGQSTHALKKDGSLWAWGYNGGDNLGVGSSSTYVSVPTQVGTENDWGTVASSYRSFGLKKDGSLWAWGYNYGGLSVSVPTRVGTENDWKAFRNFGGYTFALKQDGSLWAWGYNYNGTLGVGSSDYIVTAPTRVVGDDTWQSLPASTDGGNWAAIKADGTLWKWGSGTSMTQVGSDSDW
ncbi:MAG: Ig-like domain-containing protein, partial [Verrucomicrobiota bacterium]